MNISVPLAIALLIVAGVTPCAAQAAAPQGTSSQDGGQTFDAAVTVTAAYDSDVSLHAPAAVAQFFSPELNANSNQFLASGEYRWAARDVQIRATGTSAWVQDRPSRRVTGLSRSGGVGITALLPRRTKLIFNQTAMSTPSNLYTLFPRAAVTGPGEAAPVAHDYGTSGFDSYAYSTQATLTHEATPRLGFSFSGTGDFTETVPESTSAPPSEQGSYGMTGQVVRGLTRTTRAMGQYSYRASRVPGTSLTPFAVLDGVGIAQHTVEIGMTHTRQVSVTRRTVFDAVVGGVMVEPLDQPLAGPLRLTASYRMIGQMRAAYWFRRTWQVGALYRRGIDYVPGLTEPVLTDGFTANIGGFLSRRAEVLVAAGYASAGSAFYRGGPTFDTYTSTTRIRVPLSRPVAMYFEYLYYLYDFRRYAPLVPGVPRAFERNGFRAGLTLSVPTLEW